MAIWKFCLTSPATVILPIECLDSKHNLHKNVDHEWFSLSVVNNFIVVSVNKGYAWDGCTPKFKVCDKIVGVWDGPYNHRTKQPDTYYASLIHDVLLQFHDAHPLKRNEVDNLFYWLLKRDRFSLAVPYYVAVSSFTLVKALLNK